VKREQETQGSGVSALSGKPVPARLRDTGRALALVWAGCSTLYVAALTSLVLDMNPGLPAPSFCLSYAGLPILLPWASVFIAWRWGGIGGLMLIAGGLLYLVQAHTMAALGRPATCSVLPALLGLLPLAAGILLFAARLQPR
jgi:hypothetical protein